MHVSMVTNAETEIVRLDPQGDEMTESTRQIQFNRQMTMPIHVRNSLSAALESASRFPPMPQMAQSSATQQDICVPPEPAAQPSMYPFRDAKKIPYVKRTTYVYPYADELISSEHRERFPVIMDIFQQNLRESKKLYGQPPTKTEYKLKMCGTCTDDAKPSILVCHPQNDPKTGLLVMDILTQSHVRRQYNSLFMKVRFGIYLFFGPSPTSLGHRMENLNIRMKDTSLAGAALVSSDTLSTVSTITCGIKFLDIGGPYFALTSAHAFEEDGEDSELDAQFNEMDNSQSPLDEFGSQYDSDDEDTYTFADVEYDIAGLLQCDTKDEWEQVRKSSVPRGELSEVEHSHFDESVPVSHPTYIKPTGAWGWRTDHRNLDWALIDIGEDERWQELDLISTMYEAPGLGDKNGRVLVITSRGSLEGTICDLPAFIANSKNNSHFCEVWSVTLTNPGMNLYEYQFI